MDRTARSDLEQMLVDETAEPKALPLSLLKDITDDFSDDQEIGRDGFAVVYKGTIGDRTVAVKRLSDTNNDETQLRRVVQGLMQVKHKNLVRFLGYCVDTQGCMPTYNGQHFMEDVHRRFLCFEHIPKGSLDKYITDTYREWGTCYKIIKGICEGAQHLHENHITHMDLKPANILLDRDMSPKIADFGLSRLFDENQNWDIARRTLKTIPYRAPEFRNAGVISFSSDLYSLGLIIMEILTGQAGYQDIGDVLESWSDRLETSQQDMLCEQIRVCYETALECIKFIPKERPASARDILDRFHEMENNQISPCYDEDGMLGKIVDEVNLMVVYEPTKRQEYGKSTENTDMPAEQVPKAKKKESVEFASEKGKLGSSEKAGMERSYDELQRKLQDSDTTPMSIPLEFLKAITCNFSSESMLGKGGFGAVYKGVLQCGKIIAVKRLFEMHLKEETFQNEVSCLLRIKHKNLVKFLGYCAESRWEAIEPPSGIGHHIFPETQKRLLIFEYVSNKSLDKHISDESSGLEWNVRYEIIKGICNGLRFLHEECLMVHLDLKPENILMDSTMTPKIADFGLSRIFTEQQSRIVTDNKGGTRGYMAPEYLIHGVISNKADIFSLGVIVIEIVTGGRDYPWDPYFQQDSPQFIGPSLQQFTEKVLGRWKNKFVTIGKYKPVERYTQQVKQCVTIALKCVDPGMERRPTAKDIIEELNAVD